MGNRNSSSEKDEASFQFHLKGMRNLWKANHLAQEMGIVYSHFVSSLLGVIDHLYLKICPYFPNLISKFPNRKTRSQ